MKSIKGKYRLRISDFSNVPIESNLKWWTRTVISAKIIDTARIIEAILDGV